MEIPEPRFVRTPEGSIAYQVVGDEPLDLALMPNWMTNLDVIWEDAQLQRSLHRLASFARLILFDKRGSGLSDPIPLDVPPNMEDSALDLRSVLDAVGSERAAVFAMEHGGLPAMLFSATFPERVSALVLLNCWPRLVRADDYPWGMPPATAQKFLRGNIERWGTGRDLDFIAPELAADERFRRWYARLERLSMSHGVYEAYTLYNLEARADLRSILQTIRAPTVVIQHTRHRWIRPEHGQYLAERIPNATYIERPGEFGLWWRHDTEAVLEEVQAFLTGSRAIPDLDDRVLATVLFTDIVGSTEHATALGDSRWRELLDAHDGACRRHIERFRGREVKTTGDGFLATFDGPARAIRAALAIRDEVRGLGIHVRSGIHTGEVQQRGDDVAGIAVHIAQRVQGLAQPGEVLVSRTVVDLVAGSGIRFDDRGTHTLKGVPGEVRLFATVT